MKKIPDLFRACIEGDAELLKRSLATGENVNSRFKKEKPLRWAIQEGHLKIIKILVQNGANLSEPDIDGFTPLDTATGEGHKSIVAYLIKMGVDVNQTTTNGTALHTACAYGNLKIAKILIDAGADLKKKDNKNHTPRYYAKYYRHTEIVELIDGKLSKK